MILVFKQQLVTKFEKIQEVHGKQPKLTTLHVPIWDVLVYYATGTLSQIPMRAATMQIYKNLLTKDVEKHDLLVQNPELY